MRMIGVCVLSQYVEQQTEIGERKVVGIFDHHHPTPLDDKFGKKLCEYYELMLSVWLGMANFVFRSPLGHLLPYSIREMFLQSMHQKHAVSNM